jgi:hypothetical protein
VFTPGNYSADISFRRNNLKTSSREALAREVADWHQRGLIGQELMTTLSARYDRRGAMLTSLLKWLGLFAVAMLGMSLVAVFGAMFQSPVLGALTATFAFGFWGRKLALDKLNRHPFTASILLTAAIISAQSVVILMHTPISGQYDYDFESQTQFLVTSLFITSAIGFAVAYIYRLLWPLLIALLYLFHGIGSWHQYVGSGTYVFDIQDPKAMALIAAIVAAFGIYHERFLEETTLKTHSGFGRLYIIFGLLYLNTSLLILSIYPGKLEWVIALTVAALAQIVIGARLKDARFTGFGVVFLCIDMYTRFFEQFWDKLSAGLFFLVAGLIGLALGFAFESEFNKSRSGEVLA